MAVLSSAAPAVRLGVAGLTGSNTALVRASWPLAGPSLPTIITRISINTNVFICILYLKKIILCSMMLIFVVLLYLVCSSVLRVRIKMMIMIQKTCMLSTFSGNPNSLTHQYLRLATSNPYKFQSCQHEDEYARALRKISQVKNVRLEPVTMNGHCSISRLSYKG